MKVAVLGYKCDHDGCYEQSPAQSNWAQARRTARAAGWLFCHALGAESHYCPMHWSDRWLALGVDPPLTVREHDMAEQEAVPRRLLEYLAGLGEEGPDTQQQGQR